MSKLDKVRVDFGYAVGDLKDAPEAKQQIKDVLLKLLPSTRGHDGTFGGGTVRTGVEDFDMGYNSALAEVRQRIEEL